MVRMNIKIKQVKFKQKVSSIIIHKINIAIYFSRIFHYYFNNMFQESKSSQQIKTKYILGLAPLKSV